MERLLKRYSKDLALVSHKDKTAGTQLCAAAARFVRKSRLKIALKIWEAQVQEPSHMAGKNAGKDLLDIEVPSLEFDEDDDVPTDDDDLLFEYIEEILFDKSPIFSLQANIKQLIRLSNPIDNKIIYRLSASLSTCISNTISSLYEPSLASGYTRLRYTCVS